MAPLIPPAGWSNTLHFLFGRAVTVRSLHTTLDPVVHILDFQERSWFSLEHDGSVVSAWNFCKGCFVPLNLSFRSFVKQTIERTNKAWESKAPADI